MKWDRYVVDGMVRMPFCDFTDELNEDYRIQDIEGNYFSLYRLNEETGELSLPRSALRDKRVFEKHIPIDDLRTVGYSFEPFPSRFNPREQQEETIVRMLKYLKLQKGGLLVAGCGSGKTIMAAEIINRIGFSTCVLVHKEFLAEQWEEAFRMLVPELKVGRLKRDRCDTGNDFNVVIASTQSVTNPKREYPKEFYESFGLLVCDEVHRYGAQVWQESVTKFPAYYRLGLTATPTRYDKLMGVITANIGDVGATMDVKPLVNKVYMVRLSTEFPKSDWDKPWFDEKQRRAKLVSLLAEHAGRNQVIARNVKKAYSADRVVLIISERRIQLEKLFRLLLEDGVPKEQMGFFVGGSSKKNLAEQKRAVALPLIFTTYQMCKEGFDIEVLDSLFMCTPQHGVKQTVGRILRKLEGKSMPITVDFVDSEIDRLRGQAFARVRQYQEMSCIVKGNF